MVRWLRWHCPPDTGFEIRALAVWGWARYLSVTEAPHNTNFHTWMGKKQFRFFQTAETGKWNESGFRPPLCTYRPNWARRTSWGWWDDWDDTVLQTQDSKFEPWRSEAEHATSRSRRLPTILTFTRGWGRNNFVSFKPPRPGTEPRTLAWKAAVLTTTQGNQPTGLWSNYAIKFVTQPTFDHCWHLLDAAQVVRPSRSRRLPTILTFTRGWGRNIFVSFKPPRPGTEPRTLAWKAAVLTTTLG